MKSRWHTTCELDAGSQYLVLASSIPPRSRRSTWRLFRGASATKGQLANTEGLIGYSLLARPLAKQYATLSVWRDEEALARFAASPPHAQLMSSLAPEMAGPRFVRWAITGADGLPTWRQALDRLSAAGHRPTATDGSRARRDRT